jgi:ribosomal protein S4E
VELRPSDSNEAQQGVGPRKKTDREFSMKLKDGAPCKVIAGTHKGKSGTVRDINTSKTGHITITVVPKSGPRFKTLAKNVQL